MTILTIITMFTQSLGWVSFWVLIFTTSFWHLRIVVIIVKIVIGAGLSCHGVRHFGGMSRHKVYSIFWWAGCCVFCPLKYIDRALIQKLPQKSDRCWVSDRFFGGG